jgi:hypothetical protein
MNTKKIERLEYLSSMIAKYAHCWGENPSARLTGWVFEYNEIKSTHYHLEWKAYCDKKNFDISHDGYDCLA